MKREAKFQTIFNQYLRVKKIIGVFELKQTTTNSIPVSSVKDHQIDGLLAAQEKGIVWKLSDADPRIKPFDCISTGPINGYIAIKYPTLCCIISVVSFIEWKMGKKKKSLDMDVARTLSSYTFSNI